MVAEHFTPSYNPWDQRLCAVPDADLFASIKRGEADVVTGRIDSFVPEGIRMANGQVVEADIVVTATGLKLLPFGGIAPSVDGETVDLSRQFVWQGAMLTGVSELRRLHRLHQRLLDAACRPQPPPGLPGAQLPDRHDYAATVPLPRQELEERPLLALTSGYIQREIDRVPAPGRPRPVAGAAELHPRLVDHDASRAARVDGVHPALRRTPVSDAPAGDAVPA